jgi:hypothetical protein
VRVLRAHLSRRRAEKLRQGWSDLPRPLFCSTAGTYADPSGVRRRSAASARRPGSSTRPDGHASRPTDSATPTPRSTSRPGPTCTTSRACSVTPTSP